MIDPKMTMTLAEISAASGITMVTLKKRQAALIDAKLLPERIVEHTYEQVKLLCRPTKRRPTDVDPARVEALKLQLKTDGFAIAK